MAEPSSDSDRPQLQSPPARPARLSERRQAAEGQLWPVVAALLLVALVGSVAGWLWLRREPLQGQAPSVPRELRPQSPPASLPAETAAGEPRQHLLSRLRALRIDRGWFLSLVDARFLDAHPERLGRLPGDSAADASLRRSWQALAEAWLARVESLPPALRSRLGRLKAEDWRDEQDRLLRDGVGPEVAERLVSALAQPLLPDQSLRGMPPEPDRQLWLAAALTRLKAVRVDALTAQLAEPISLRSRVRAGGVRLITIQVAEGQRLALQVSGTERMRMTVFSAAGTVAVESSPLREVLLPAGVAAPLQLLITNEGVASGALTVTCQAEPAGQDRNPRDTAT